MLCSEIWSACDLPKRKFRLGDGFAKYSNNSYVRGSANSTIGKFAIEANGGHWYLCLQQNPEQFRQPMAPMILLEEHKLNNKKNLHMVQC